MFNRISTFLSTAWEILDQFPAAMGGFEEEPKVPNPIESPLAKRMEVVPAGTANGGLGLHKDVIWSIFRRLPPHELLNVGLVCRLWYQVSSSDSLWMSYPLREVFPQATFIDKPLWETYVDLEQYGWDMQDPGRPYVDKWDYIALRRIESAVEGNLGFTVLTLFPGHELNDTIDFAGSGLAGNSTQIQFLWPRIVEVLGEEEVKEPVIVAVTNNVFKNSRNKSVEQQQERVEELDCEMPGILPVMDVALMRHRISDPEAPVRLFPDDPATWTRLKQKIDGRNLVFGYFAPGGPHAYSSYFDLEDRGVGGQRKFKVIGH